MLPQFREYGRKNSENVWISGTFQVLLDKDGSYADVGREKENLLFYEVPDRKDFEGCCSEFFRVLKTCAKSVLRKEIPAAMFYLNLSVRDVLNRMIRWYICLRQSFFIVQVWKWRLRSTRRFPTGSSRRCWIL